MKAVIRVVISGAAGQIAYNAVFEVMTGRVFGYDQPIHLVLYDVEQAQEALKVVEMELIDSAFPLAAGRTLTADPLVAFKDADYAVLLGAFPRGPGMERKDLLEKNKGIFKVQGEAIEQVGKPTLKVLVVGNPANTNGLILKTFAPKLLPGHVTSMSRLDHNRTIGCIAEKLQVLPDTIKNVFVLGNHSATMVPIICQGKVGDKMLKDVLPKEWVPEMMATVRTRGGKVIEARKKSSAASAAEAAMNHLRDWHQGTKMGEVVSVSIIAPKNAPYNVPEGLMFSFPCISKAGNWEIQDLPICEELKAEVAATVQDLLTERKLALDY